MKNNPQLFAQPQPNGLFNHETQAYAYEEFETAANAILNGCSYKLRNVPDEGSDHHATDFDEKRANGPKKDSAMGTKCEDVYYDRGKR